MGKKKQKKSDKSKDAKADKQSKPSDEEVIESASGAFPEKLPNKFYEEELYKYQAELVQLQDWVRKTKQKIVVIFEGRDAAGKGGAIKRISERVSPRTFRIVALGVPTEQEKSQWYFQRYVANLPSGGEVILFDRSWYNRAGVERVMGFCSDDEYAEFLRACPQFERMLVLSGITLIKYWFSISDEEQERRFKARINDPTKTWKLSPMDIESRSKWVEYSRAKDEMFKYTDTSIAPWYVVEADDKRRARLNCMRHLLSLIPYESKPIKPITLPPQQLDDSYRRPPISAQRFVPNYYPTS